MKFPFTIKSDIELGHRSTALVVDRDADVIIREGDVPDAIESKLDGAAFQIKRGEFLHNIPDGSSLYVNDGREIIYRRGPQTTDRDLALFILGSAWGAVCYQRGLIPIHASANIADGKIVAFTGHSGAGKSTLAANLAVRGYSFFTDDTLIFDQTSNAAEAICFAGQKQLKLWRDAIEVTGATALHPVRQDETVDKHFAVPPSPSDLIAAPLDRLFVITRSRNDAKEPNTIVNLKGSEALLAIRANLYRPHYAEILMGRSALFLGLKQLADKVKVARFVRQTGEENYDAALDYISAAIGPASANAI
ncbi:ATP-binding cassette domain-containing protein [Erythrobacter sp. F6033]|uniref:ATP-binding cassette domain-containing protein n=1 Tax=Erythrobacter sp. F6033 TaxID=2926401 RepID=UPI001FF0E6C7|nr:ATP-binding cassette domain-containing protein [Erythrobacter sp. F6033]MCK0127770.1 ATP-binding cassette domain-containing protein [Erythrobacter sp. F6033]